MWPFHTIKTENEVQYLRNKVKWLEELLHDKGRKSLAEQNARAAEIAGKIGALGGNVPQMGGNYLPAGAGVIGRPKLATDLPVTRVADLAGYLGRVHEQLTFAAHMLNLAVVDGSAKNDLVGHLQRAAAKAGSVQMDLLEIIQQQRDEDEARAEQAEREASQWTTDELNRAMSGRVSNEPEPINRIRPLDDSEGQER